MCEIITKLFGVFNFLILTITKDLIDFQFNVVSALNKQSFRLLLTIKPNNGCLIPSMASLIANDTKPTTSQPQLVFTVAIKQLYRR